MPLTSHLISEGKFKRRDRLTNKARDRASFGRITSSIDSAKSPSDSLRHNENHTRMPADRKRKVDALDEESKASSSQLLAASSSADGRRKHKSPRTSEATRESSPNHSTRTPTAITTSTSTNSNEKKDASNMITRATNAVIPRLPPRIVRSFVQETSEMKTLREEVFNLRKEAERSRKTVAQQAQTIEELKQELSSMKKMSRMQKCNIDKLRLSGKKSEELLGALQENLQCQICLEMLYQPHTLHPCGHVACQSCLQTWFKTASKQLNEEDMDDVPPILRVKRCPCCRAVVLSRPTPLFLVRDLVESINSNHRGVSTLSFENNPWRGIFPPENRVPDIDMDATDDDNESDPDYDPRQPPAFFFDSHEEGNDPEYSLPDYAPPYYISAVSRADFPNMSAEHFELLQRGATPGMIRCYEMRLDREQGIVAWSQCGAELFLGWNISFDEDEDSDGRHFMEWIDSQIADYPERWNFDESVDHLVYRRLVHEEDHLQVLGQVYDDYDSGDDW